MLDSNVIIAYYDEADKKQNPLANVLVTELLKRLDARSVELHCSVIARAEVWSRRRESSARSGEWLQVLLDPRKMIPVGVDWDTALRGATLDRVLFEKLREEYWRQPNLDLEQLVADVARRLKAEPDAVKAHTPVWMFRWKQDCWRIDWRLGDALIAACAETARATLITADRNDFRHLEGTLCTDILYLQDMFLTE
jgi:predicted nucleic acid-binding protein